MLRLALLFLFAFSLPAAGAPSSSPAAKAPAPGDATFFVGARKGGQLSVLAYRTATGKLQPFGPPLTLAQAPSPNYENAIPEFHYLLSERPDRVFIVVSTFEGWELYAGDGKRWNPLVTGSRGMALHPYISSDGELVLFDTWGTIGGEPKAIYRVATWDGKILDEWSYQERGTYGFVETGRKWVSVLPHGGDPMLHEEGAAPRPLGKEPLLKDNYPGLSTDRYEVKDTGIVLDRQTGNSIGKYAPEPQAGSTRGSGYLVSAALASAPAAALMRTVYTAGGCGDIPCFKGWALDLLMIEDGPGAPGSKGGPGLRAVRLSEQASSTGRGPIAGRIDAGARHAGWIEDAHTFATYDLRKGARRLIKTEYELIFGQSQRR